MWRDSIEERAGADLDRLSGAVEDQKLFAQIVRELLSHLDMASGEAPDETRSDEDSEEAPQNPDQNESDDRDDEESKSSADMDTALAAEDAEQEGESDSADAPYGETEREADAGDAEEAAEARRPATNAAERAGAEYLAYTTRFDETIRAEELCDVEELDRLRAYLDKQLLASVVGGGAAGEPAAAPADGAAEPFLGIRPRRRHARPRAPAAGHHRSPAAALLQARKGHGFSRYGGDAAARQFRLDARAPDHRRRHLRRHSGAHAGALRRQGRDTGLHHPRLERRPVPRGLDRRRARNPIPAV